MSVHFLRVAVLGACAVSMTGCMGLMGMPGMMGGGAAQPQQAQANNDSGVGSTAGSVAGSQMADQVPFGSEIGGFFGRKAEKTVRSGGNQAQPAGSTQTPAQNP